MKTNKLSKKIVFLILLIGLMTCVSCFVFANNKQQVNVKTNIAVAQEKNDCRYLIEVDGKYGYINQKGEEVIKPQYDYAEGFLDGLAFICNNIDAKGNQKCDYIDIYGKIQKPQPRFIDRNSKAAMIDASNYSEIGDFHEGLAHVCKTITNQQEKCGYINKDGKIIIPLKYDYASDFSEGLASVSIFDKNGKRLLKESGYIDKTGKLILKGDYFYDFSNGVASDIYCSQYFDKTGKVIVDISKLGSSSIDGVCSYFNDGLLLIRLKNNYFGYVNKKGELLIKTNAKTDEDYTPLAPYFSEGLAYIELNNKWGFIDKTGKVVIKPRFIKNFDGNIFEDMKFNNGLARVKEKNKYGYINKLGNYIWTNNTFN